LVARKRGSKADLDASASLEFNGLYAGHGGGTVAFGTQSNPPITGCDGQGAPGGKNSASNHAQTVAERAAGGQAQQLARDHGPVDAEQARNVFRRTINAGAIVLDDIAAIFRKLLDRNLGAVVETVIGELLENKLRQLVPGHAGAAAGRQASGTATNPRVQ